MLPKISVLVPIKNEERYIKKCLACFLNQTYSKAKTEIFLIDGMSTDNTRIILNNFITKNKHKFLSICVLDNSKGHRATGLNIGISRANTGIIIRIDSKTIIPNDYIEKCVSTLLKTKADNVGGKQVPIVECSIDTSPLTAILTQTAIGIALSHPFGVGNAQFRVGNKSNFVDTVYLGCFKKSVFDRIGLFDEKSSVISEDSDINHRIRKAGGKVYFNKDIIAYYYPRNSLKDLWDLYFRYGGSKAGVLLKRKSLTAWRQFVPLAFLLALIFLPVLGLFYKVFFYLWCIIIGIYFTLDCTVSLHLALKNKEVIGTTSTKSFILSLKHRIFLLVKLFLVFPAMHISWALGFWRRLLRRSQLNEYWEG